MDNQYARGERYDGFRNLFLNNFRSYQNLFSWPGNENKSSIARQRALMACWIFFFS